MKKLEAVLVTLLIVALTFGALGCAKEEITPTPTATVKSTPTPSTIPLGTASFRFYSAEEQGPGDGIYSYVMADSDVTAIRGRVFLQGDPVANWLSGSEWPVNYPQLVPGSILVLFNEDTAKQRSQYSQPGEGWQLNNADTLIVWDGIDVRYYSAGYVCAKFQNVPVQSGKVTILPDVTLNPSQLMTSEDEWIFYTESGASMFH